MITQLVKLTVIPEQTEAFKAALIEDSKGAAQEAVVGELEQYMNFATEIA